MKYFMEMGVFFYKKIIIFTFCIFKFLHGYISGTVRF